MRRMHVGVILAGFLAGFCPGFHPLRAQTWSSGGRWVAFALAERPARAWPGWIFGAQEPPENRLAAPVVHRIWTTEAETGASVLLYESLEPTTRPGWKRDGTALAYGRVVIDEDHHKRLELVIQDAPKRTQIVETSPLGGMADLSRLHEAQVVWSPEGKFLVTPRLEPEGLAVVRVENGSVAFDLAGASRASWSPDGARLAYYRDGSPPVLEVLDVRSGKKTVLAEADESSLFPAPTWSPDGESILFLAWNRDGARPVAPKPATEGLSLRLERCNVQEGKRDLATELAHPSLPSAKDLIALQVGFDVEGTQLFHAISVQGKDVGIHWDYLRRQESRKLFNPFENSRAVVDLSVCPLPNSTRLVLRFGPPERPTPPAFCDAALETLTPIVPDDETRAAWILAIFSAMNQALSSSEDLFGGVEPMPTRLPMPGDISASHPGYFRLRELARIGRPLCDRPADSPPPSPELASLLDEARLIFSYLLGDFEQAMTSVEAREEETASPDERLRLLGLRAQIHVGLGQMDRAGAIVERLRKRTSNGSTRLQETGSGYALVTLPDAAESWPEMLSTKLDALTHGPGEQASFDDPILDHVNPDAPQPGLGLDPLPGMPPPPPPMIPGAEAPGLPPGVQIRILPNQPRAIPDRRPGPPERRTRVRILPDRIPGNPDAPDRR